MLDDGRLTDGRGRTADFSNTVIIMTSNIGSKRLLETDPKLFETAEGLEALRDVLQEELRAFLRPEFLNRIDDVVLFRPLSKEDLRGIVDIQLRRLEKLVADRELKMQSHARRPKTSSSTSATSRRSGRGRSSAPSSRSCRIRWPRRSCAAATRRRAS